MLKIDYNSIPRHTNEAANRRIVEVADSNFLSKYSDCCGNKSEISHKPGYPQY